VDLNTLAIMLADKDAYNDAGGAGGGILVSIFILWLLFGGGSKK